MHEVPAKFEFVSGDINWTTVILVITFLVILPLQLWLCKKAKRVIIRLLPAIVFAVTALILALVAYLVGSWEGLFILLLSLYSAFCAVVCMVGFFSHLVTKHLKRFSNK